MQGVYSDTFEKYQTKISKGKQEPVGDLDGLNNIHNEIVKRLNDQGCGRSQIENEVHELRLEIQKYFENFIPRGIL
jgi:glutamine synthetase